jgi:ankyrin repeat protein
MNEPDAFGTYPIQFAMSQDDPDMVKLVIESGADPISISVRVGRLEMLITYNSNIQ